MQSSLGMWREVNMKRFHFMALIDFIWKKNTMLCISPDAEIKQQDLSKGLCSQTQALGSVKVGGSP